MQGKCFSNIKAKIIAESKVKSDEKGKINGEKKKLNDKDLFFNNIEYLLEFLFEPKNYFDFDFKIKKKNGEKKPKSELDDDEIRRKHGVYLKNARLGFYELVKESGKYRELLNEYLVSLAALVRSIYISSQKGLPINIIDLNRDTGFYTVGLTFDQVSKILDELRNYTSGGVKKAGKRSYRTISRCFSLKPLDKSDGSNNLDKYIRKFLNLKNRYIEVMVEEIRKGYAQETLQVLRENKSLFDKKDDESKKRLAAIKNSRFYRLFSGTSTTHIRREILGSKTNKGILFGVDESEYPEIKFISRIPWYAAYGAYNAFRNWVIRNEDLRTLCEVLPLLFNVPTDPNWYYPSLSNLDFFLQGKPYTFERLKNVLKYFKRNCFGKVRDFSKDYFNNHVLQLRNLVFDRLDFRSSELLDPNIRGFKNFIREGFILLCDQYDNGRISDNRVYQMLNDAMDDFKKKVKGTYVSVPRGELPRKFASDYVRMVKYTFTKWSKSLFSLLEKYRKIQSQKGAVNKVRGIKVDTQNILNRIDRVLGISVSLNDVLKGLWRDAKSFKAAHMPTLLNNLSNIRIMASTGNPPQNLTFDLDNLILEGFGMAIKPFKNIIDAFKNSQQLKINPMEDVKVVRYIFTPSHKRHHLKTLSFDNFKSYIVNRIANNIRSCLSDFFIKFTASDNSKFSNYLSQTFDYINSNIYVITKAPVFSAPSIQFYSAIVYQGEYCAGTSDDPEKSYSHICLGVDKKGKKKWLNFLIYDKKNIKINKEVNGQNIVKIYNSRIGELILNRGALPQFPVLTFRDGKLLLSIPFTVKREYCSKPSPEDNFKVGAVDLGLRHFAVVSIKDRSGRLIRRYFINHRILDYKFRSGTFVWANPLQTKHSDIKGRLRNLRRMIRIIQARVNKFEAYIETLDADLYKRIKKAKAAELMDPGTELKKELHNLAISVSPKLRRLHYNRVDKYIRRKSHLDRLWRRVNNINKHIANLVARAITDIAVYHKLSYVIFEDLKWSRNSKKKDVGKFLAYWQVHWFYSRIQEITDGLCSSVGIYVLRVDPRGTSLNCSMCGNKGIRTGAYFTCKNRNCPGLAEVNRKRAARGLSLQNYYRLNSDLNAARNIADRGISKVIKILGNPT